MPNGVQGGGFGRGGRRGMGGGYGLGPGGDCICSHCHYKEPHKAGIPCYNQTCPHCGRPLTRSIK